MSVFESGKCIRKRASERLISFMGAVTEEGRVSEKRSPGIEKAVAINFPIAFE